MRKYVCSVNEIKRDLLKYGYDIRFLYFPRSNNSLLFKTFDSKTLEEFYFCYNKTVHTSVRISKEDYYRYIDKIDNCNYFIISKLSRLSLYTLGGKNE